MSEHEGTSEGVFQTPKVSSCVLALAFPRLVEVRRRAIAVEDALKSEYQQSQIINSSDDAPPDLPRFIVPSKDGRRGIAVAQTSIQMNLLFADDTPADLETIASYVNDHQHEIFDTFTTVKGISPAFFGVTTQVQVPSRLTDTQMRRLFADSMLKSPDKQRGYYDLQVKRTKIANKKFYNNITFANYRTYTIQGQLENPPRIPLSFVIQHGIEVTSDFNDRYSYNEKIRYQTSKTVAQDIVRYAMNAVREAVKEVEGMEP